jgi:hypothetical protein
MKKLFFGLILTTLTSCSITNEISGTIEKDCTGLYIRTLNVDYRICNEEKIMPEDFQKQVTLNYSKVYDCTETSPCPLYHPYAGAIRVKKVLR